MFTLAVNSNLKVNKYSRSRSGKQGQLNESAKGRGEVVTVGKVVTVGGVVTVGTLPGELFSSLIFQPFGDLALELFFKVDIGQKNIFKTK